MELSAEDALRINVLLHNQPLAIRINESRMILDGLLAERETSIQLNPTGNRQSYLRAVRAVLSEYALGTPGGYPLYLQRWTRMGTMREESLEQLLLLGEPTAVFAVVCAQGLTDELARRAWWAVEDAENARRMLETPEVVAGQSGPLLARYLVDYLPFESDSEKISASLRLALQPGLLHHTEVAALWQRASRKGAWLVGFLQARPGDLPLVLPPFPRSVATTQALQLLAEEGNRLAAALLYCDTPAGQAFLATCDKVLQKPGSQDVVTATLAALAAALHTLRPEGDPDLPFDELQQEAHHFARHHPEALACTANDPTLQPTLEAVYLLSGVGYGVVRPIFRRSSAVGTLMRRQLKPVLEPLLRQLLCVLG